MLANGPDLQEELQVTEPDSCAVWKLSTAVLALLLFADIVWRVLS
jgi:hypothetical protein